MDQNFELGQAYGRQSGNGARLTSVPGVADKAKGAGRSLPSILPPRMAFEGTGTRGREAAWLLAVGSTESLPLACPRNDRLQDAASAGAASSLGRFRAELVLDSLPDALLAFDADGGVAYCNRAARQLLAAARGVALGGGGASPARLICSSTRASARLATALRTRRTETIGILLDAGSRLVLKLMPEQDDVRVGELLALDDGTRCAGDAGWLGEAFALSPAEARALQALAEADLTRDAAARLGISSNTLKDHLAAIYAKTGCSRKVQLFRLMGFAYGA